MSQAFPAKYFYHFELKVDSKELCGVRWTDAVDGRKHYAQEALNERLRAAVATPLVAGVCFFGLTGERCS
jgi:hypothetical protein